MRHFSELYQDEPHPTSSHRTPREIANDKSALRNSAQWSDSADSDPHESRKHTGEEIPPSVGDHPWANTSAPVCENPEQNSTQSDSNRPCQALVGVAQAECRGRQQDAQRDGLGHSSELAL